MPTNAKALNEELKRMQVMYAFLHELVTQCAEAKTVSLHGAINRIREVELHIANANDHLCEVVFKLHPEKRKELYRRLIQVNGLFR